MSSGLGESSSQEEIVKSSLFSGSGEFERKNKLESTFFPARKKALKSWPSNFPGQEDSGKKGEASTRFFS